MVNSTAAKGKVRHPSPLKWAGGGGPPALAPAATAAAAAAWQTGRQEASTLVAAVRATGLITTTVPTTTEIEISGVRLVAQGGAGHPVEVEAEVVEDGTEGGGGIGAATEGNRHRRCRESASLTGSTAESGIETEVPSGTGIGGWIGKGKGGAAAAGAAGIGANAILTRGRRRGGVALGRPEVVAAAAARP